MSVFNKITSYLLKNDNTSDPSLTDKVDTNADKFEIQRKKNKFIVTLSDLPTEEKLREKSKDVFDTSKVIVELSNTDIVVYAVEEIGDIKHKHLLLSKSVVKTDKGYQLIYEYDSDTFPQKEVSVILEALP